MQAINWVRTDQELATLCSQWQQLDFIALDTEFIRERTFYPVAGLLQLSTGDKDFLLDPLTIKNWHPFAKLLENQAVTKVFHACGEDLEVLQELTGSLPEPLFDTQHAAAFAGLGFSLGYTKLVQHFLDIELGKEQTRSDWLQRPLTVEQEQYAVWDVKYLAQLYPQLDALLTADRRSWVLEDGASLVAAQQKPLVLESLWQNIKSAWRLRESQLAVAQQLCIWREQQARKRDVPRNRLLRDASILELANLQPKSLAQLAQVQDIHPQVVRKDGQNILLCIEHALEIPLKDWPQALPEPLPLAAGKLIKSLRLMLSEKAQQLQIAPEVLLKKKVLEDFLYVGFPRGPWLVPDSLQGWRRNLLAEELIVFLEKATQ